MSKLVKARDGAIVSLDHVAAIFHDANGFNSASGHTKSVAISLVGGAMVTVLETDPNYQRWLDFMDQKPPLKSSEDERREQIVNGAFDPFIDSDKLTTVYSLFDQIPVHDGLMLCIESEDIGSVRSKTDPSRVYVEWHSAIEAIDRLHAYRESVS